MTTTPSPTSRPRPHRSRWIAALLVLAGFAAGAVVTAAVVHRADTKSDDTLAARLISVQSSCRDWMSSTGDESVTDDQWCTDMFAWMSEQSGGSMMWRDPEQMGASCRRWVDEAGPDAGSSPAAACTDMVDWMEGHMSGPRGSWMMDGR